MLYTCTVLPECLRDDPPRLGVRNDLAGPSAGLEAVFYSENARRKYLAASEMLAALEEAEPFLRSGDVDTRGGMIELSRIANKFAAIIAKAKGGAE